MNPANELKPCQRQEPGRSSYLSRLYVGERKVARYICGVNLNVGQAEGYDAKRHLQSRRGSGRPGGQRAGVREGTDSGEENGMAKGVHKACTR